MRNVLFYHLESGRCPVMEFLDSLDSKTAQRVTWVLDLIEELERIPSQYFKKLENTEIWEARAQSGNNAIRLLGFWDTGKFVVLCHGFAKKTQKTPLGDIRAAEQRKTDYFRRKGRI
jgi:phage-related protein